MFERVINSVARKKDADTSSIQDLSKRALEVFALIGEGLATCQIAERLRLSVKFARIHAMPMRQHAMRSAE